MEKGRKKKEIILLTVLFAGYLIFNGILLAGHELWRDEANVWLIARELSPLQLFREIRYQGHPCLWYLLIMPFAKAGFPFKTLSVLSYLVMAAAAGIFTYHASFHPVTKFICLFSPIFSYYYPVVARNYCLIALLMMLLALLYPKKNEKPFVYGLLLGLLVQADTIALATAGLLSLMWLWESILRSLEEKKWRAVLTAGKGLWIPFASLLLWMMEFSNVSDSPEFQFRIMSVSEFLHEVRNFSYSILTRMTGMGQAFDLFLIILFLLSGVLISIRLKNIWPMVIMAGTFLFEVIFSILVYQLHIWHYIAVAFVLIWFFWFGKRQGGSILQEGKRRYLQVSGSVLSELLLMLLAVTMFIRWNSPEESSSLENALMGVYSDGVNVAGYIEENIAEDELIFSTDIAESSTVQAYLGKNYTFYYAGNGQREVYADYTEEQKKTVTYDALLSFIKGEFPEKDSFYILESPSSCITDIPDEAKLSFEVCYQTSEETARGENYTLYCVKIK
ncbi:MAG: hypothetical protein ACI4ED_02005 [Suilimivivens sp.]